MKVHYLYPPHIMANNKETIISLMQSLNEVEYINRGWCLFASYAVYLKAKELWIKGVSLVQIDCRDNYIPRNKAFLKGNAPSPVAGNHYALKIDWEIVDSEWAKEWKDERIFNIRKHSDIDKLCVASLKMASEWNHYFDRKSWVRQIKKILGIDLRHCL